MVLTYKLWPLYLLFSLASSLPLTRCALSNDGGLTLSPCYPGSSETWSDGYEYHYGVQCI